MRRWLALLMLTGCVGGLDANLRDGVADEPSAQVALDAGLDARVVTADASDAADLRE